MVLRAILQVDQQLTTSIGTYPHSPCMMMRN